MALHSPELWLRRSGILIAANSVDLRQAAPPLLPLAGSGLGALGRKGVLSHIEWVRRSEDNETLGTIGFPGMGPWHPSAAPAVTRRKTTALESNHYEGSTPVVICSTSTQNTLPGDSRKVGK